MIPPYVTVRTGASGPILDAHQSNANDGEGLAPSKAGASPAPARFRNRRSCVIQFAMPMTRSR